MREKNPNFLGKEVTYYLFTGLLQTEEVFLFQ